MVDETIRTHTSYAHCARMLKKANEDLQNVKKYLDPASPNNYETYLNNLRKLKASSSPPTGIDAKIATTETQLASFKQTEQDARALVGKYLPQLQALESSENFWEAPAGKYDEYMYILEEETCTSTRTNWQTVATACQPGKWGMPLPALPAGEPTFTFSNRTISYTGVKQTDAVRIWNHNVTLNNLQITDPRSYTEAHRDGIQLIPPPKYEDKIGADGKTTKIKLADQMVGTILENPTVSQCKVHAPTGPLQGIFMSDGLCRNATITNNEITVQGAHAISLAGVLSGNITGNTLHEVAVPEPIPPAKKQAQLPPRIRLFPLRIGGNMADDGVVCIFGFAAGNSVSYGNVADSGNKVIRLGGSVEAIKVEDLRKELPLEFSKMGVGLTDFNYDGYFEACSRWTLRDFISRDKWGYDQMVAWVNLRYQEYSSGQRIPPDSPLPAPSPEQQDPKAFGVRDMLLKAKTALQGNVSTFLDTRLADLQETAIRSFTMKRIAIKHGKVVPLYDLGGYNSRREAMLKWLVESGDLANLVPNSNQESTYKIRVVDSIGKTIKNIPYFIEIDNGTLYKGFSDSNGFILNIPIKETGKLKIILGVQALEKW
ncbi:hypothetical protein [Thiothrix lacustris]|uniref:hypothetical protein n=1 Tax=Thiothrix lacustris TaxID=525917 RepID=UPI0027E4B13B|nr:hypothetical protein [Thiothrix lacustris]WMP18873.1 hypothetical protein RCS87_07355 [Thiothrix lacustris]